MNEEVSPAQADGTGRRSQPAHRAALVASLFLAGTLAVNGLGGSTGSVRAARPATRAGVARPVGSTKPANGDANPYGIAIVPKSIGSLVKGAVLVSNFNNGQNQAGRPQFSTVTHDAQPLGRPCGS